MAQTAAANRIGHVVSEVREQVTDGGEHLHKLDQLLGAGVELLDVVADARDVLGVLGRGQNVLVQLSSVEASLVST